MKFNTSMVLLALLAAVLSVATSLAQGNKYPAPQPTFDADAYTTWHKLPAKKSRRADVQVRFNNAQGQEDYINLFRLDLVGDAYERGYAHGHLLSREIVQFMWKMDEFYAKAVLDLDTSGLPEPLQKIFAVLKVKGAIAAPAVMKKAMLWVWDYELQYTPQYIKDEIRGIAVGLCDSVNAKTPQQEPRCDVDHWESELRAFNMMPELIKMACTAYGAWGKATPSGKGLVQLRALDFGSGPFSNYTVVATHRPSGTAATKDAFVSVVFPGMVGAITGVSQSGVGISEKVWMTYEDKNNLQPGSFDGEADVFVLRDLLQKAKNKADGEAYLKSLNRTWAIWIGLGDYDTMSFDLVGYRQKDANVYNDVSMPSMTGQPYIESIAYVDKHPQPTNEGPQGTLPEALKDFWGNITLETSKTVTQYHGTGDVHIASYDFENKEMYLAIGKIDKKGEYGEDNRAWRAYNRPYVKFDLQNLWQGK